MEDIDIKATTDNLLSQLEKAKKEAPGKGEADNYLKDMEYPSKSGAEHVQPSLFNMANEKDY